MNYKKQCVPNYFKHRNMKSLIIIFTNYTDVVPRKTVNGEQYM